MINYSRRFYPTTALFILVFLAIVFQSCQSDDGPIVQESTFELLSYQETGVDFRNNLVVDVFSNFNVLSFEYFYNGAGIAVGDINNDGRDDLFFTGNMVSNKLYINKGNMKFEDVTEGTNLNTGKKWSNGATMIDINQDGWLDIYVCQGGPYSNPADRKNLLFINNGDLTFTESATIYGLDNENMSTQAAFFDYDNDGDYDCYVMNHAKYFWSNVKLVHQELEDEAKLRAASSSFYKNENGKFVEITKEAGVLKFGYGLGLVVSDINEDGWLDVYQANDYTSPDAMFINQKNGTFRDEIKARTDHISWFSMGADIADINNDGKKEIAVVDMATSDHIRNKTLMAPMSPALFSFAVDSMRHQYQYMFNAFQLNQGDNTYMNIPFATGVAKTEWSWAALLADFDNDGFRDYFIANGYRKYNRDNDFRNYMRDIMAANNNTVPNDMRKDLYSKIPEVKLPNVMYKNDGHLHFNDVSKDWGLNKPSCSNGAAYADLDKDGDLDLVISNVDDIAFIYENKSADAGQNFFRVDLTSDNPMQGAIVKLHTEKGILHAEYGTVRGFQSSVENILHFGLGDQEKIDFLEVSWPDGRYQKITSPKINRVLKVDYADSQNNSAEINKRPTFFTAAQQSLIDFRHVENNFNDFEKEVLLPYKQSTLGPFITSGDANGDGMEDVFIGGAKGQSGNLYLQTSGGTFEKNASQSWAMHAMSEDMGGLFFDADGDGDQDLYICSGGNEYDQDEPALNDRLYINNGKGQYTFKRNALPNIANSNSRVVAIDFDQDGDQDLVVGGRLIPGQYPATPASFLLENVNGRFNDVTAEKAPRLKNAGLINDLLVFDFDGDGRDDVVAIGEWMAPLFLANQNGQLVDVSDKSGLDDKKGWWMRMHKADVDGDGDLDIVAGNLGLNSKFKATAAEPFKVYAGDFDTNGTFDVVLSKKYKGKEVPVRGRQCSSEQMPFINEKFPTFTSFANASVDDIIGEDKEEMTALEVNTFESAVFINQGNGQFEYRVLPYEAQLSVTYGIESRDVNQDGHVDLILAGNLYQTEIETPRLDAGRGTILLGDGEGNFNAMAMVDSGLKLSKDVKDIRLIALADDRQILLATNNNDGVLTYVLKSDNTIQ